MKKIKGVFRAWRTGEDVNFIPRELDLSSVKFETVWTGTKTKEDPDTKEEYQSCTAIIAVFDGSTKIGRFFVDATMLGKQLKAELQIPEKGICDIKGGKITNIKGE